MPLRKINRFAPMLALLSGLLVTAIATFLIQKQATTAEQQRFQRLTERITNAINQRIGAQIIALEGLRAFFVGSNQVTRSEFRAYTERIPLEQFPGLAAWAYVERVSDAQLPAFIARQRRDGAPQFDIKRRAPGPVHFVGTFVEPMSLNSAGLGFDLASEPRRTSALLAASSRDLPTLSRRIQLVFDSESHSAFLLVLPVIRDKDALRTERDSNLTGWVVAPLRIGQLFSGIAEDTEHLVDFELYEDEPYLRENLIYDADGHIARANQSSPIVDQSYYKQRRHRQMVELLIGGQTWYIDISSNNAFNSENVSEAPTAVLAVGLILSLLVTGLFGNSQRMTAKAQALAEEMTANLRLKEGELRELVSELEQQRTATDEHCIVAITDTHGTILYANDKLLQVSGYSRQELIGSNHRMLNSEFHPVGFWQEMYDTIGSGQVWHGEVRNRRKNGDPYWVATTIVPFLNARGEPVRYMALRTEITAQKATEAELIEHRNNLQALVNRQTADLILARDAAEAANRAKSEFISNMSHEMRTPLHGVMALSDMGVKRIDKLEKDKIVDYFQRIHASGQRLLTLVNGVLELAQRDSGTGVPHLVAHDLVPILHAARQAGHARAAAKHQEIVIEDGNTPSVAMLDQAGIKLVLRHLLDNAIRYSPAGSRIVLRLLPAKLSGAAGERAAVCVEVSDPGVGIPEAELEHIFRDFTQSTHTRTGAGGTGLGLGICRRVVANHGGHIWARNNPEGGATLAFTLALSEAENSASRDADYPAGYI